VQLTMCLRFASRNGRKDRRQMQVNFKSEKKRHDHREQIHDPTPDQHEGSYPEPRMVRKSKLPS
jgi:hypothetical protein